MNVNSRRLPASASFAAVLLAGSVFTFAGAARATEYIQTNLVTDNQAVAPAANTDPNLKNPWGISHTITGSPFWVSDNDTGLSTLYNGAGTSQALVVTIPPIAGGTTPAHPTGQVWNPNTGPNDFKIGSATTNFIFATLEGTIVARTTGTTLTNGFDATTAGPNFAGSVYTGLAIANNGTASFLYAANFTKGRVDVFNANFQPVGMFTDPGLPAGYSPFNVQTLNGHVYVTYAIPDPVTHEQIGSGLGFIDEFNLDGTLQTRIASQGLLDAPWGLDIAPAGFGQYAGDLLVGNFGDGTINVFNPNSDNGGTALGTLLDTDGDKITISGLWGLINGDGGANGDPNSVYFAAGINGEQDGLFGSLAVAVPEPASLALFAAGLATLAGAARRRRRMAVP